MSEPLYVRATLCPSLWEARLRAEFGKATKYIRFGDSFTRPVRRARQQLPLGLQKK